MTRIDPVYLEHERKRFMRPDAHRFVRADWRRYVAPDSEVAALYAGYERKYSPDQPRVPAGSREGGQWTSDGGGFASGSSSADRPTLELIAASRKGGHHYVPTAEVRKRGISDEAAKVFDERTTGPLYDTRSNQWDTAHREYNKAVGEALDEYLMKNGIQPGKMTADQAREFLGKMFESTDPRIKNYNIGIQMRELMQRLFRRGGGRE